MKIGIAYDTREMYNLTDRIYYDFAEETSILLLKRELEKQGHEVMLLGNAVQIMKLLKKDKMDCDLVYNTVEGVASRNREGIIPALLEVNNIPYIGTDAFGLSLTLNKVMTKILADYYKIKTPEWCLISYPLQGDIHNALQNLTFPIIVKPNYEGNSSGIVVCSDLDEALVQIPKLLNIYQTDILAEQFIFGKEITVPYIDCSPAAMWDVTTVDVQRTNDFWLDINWKVNGDYQNIIFDLDSRTKQEFKRIISVLFKIIGCRDFCRFDFRLTDDQQIYFIEANPLPALFPGGSFDAVGQKNGYTYGETLQLIVDTACARLAIPKI